MITETLDILARTASGQPALLFLGIMLLTFLLEDAVALAAGLLASQMLIDPDVALAALVVGTVVGDLGLYGIGRHAAGTRIGRRLGAARGVASATDWLASRSTLAVASARFLPGLRLPVYLASGYAALPFGRFAAIVAATCLVWTPGIFLLAHSAGSASADILHAVAMVGFAILFIGVAARWLPRVLLASARASQAPQASVSGAVHSRTSPC